MKAGTIIRLPDGREGTVVYHGLDGYGIKFGRHTLADEDLDAITGGNQMFGKMPEGFKWQPEAMLRKAFVGCDRTWPGMEVVGDVYTIVADEEEDE